MSGYFRRMNSFFTTFKNETVTLCLCICICDRGGAGVENSGLRENTDILSLLFVLVHPTLICLFSSRSLTTSICSRLHSSMIFFTSPSSSETLADLGSAECSVLTEEVEEDTVLLLSLSCCGERVRVGEGSRARVEGEEGRGCRDMQRCDRE